MPLNRTTLDNMITLDVYKDPLTTKTASHLLRRLTVGPTQKEIFSYTGLTATQAVRQLISNANYTPNPPVDFLINRDSTPNDYSFHNKPFDYNHNNLYLNFIQYWWQSLMMSQQTPINLLDKLTLFWQNHFTISSEAVEDYRFINRYLLLIRNHALGNFHTLTFEISKDPAILRYYNGNTSEKESPNENYSRYLLELFTIGLTNEKGIENYSENDVKAAARVLTGWKDKNYLLNGSVSIEPDFELSKHDTTDKTFSSYCSNTIIPGRSNIPSNFGTIGDADLTDLVTMILKHPQTPKFICRKLYCWYVNPYITQTIETNIITPLATYFASKENNYSIQPIIEKLFTSQVFFDDNNIGTIIKSPVEFVLGTLRFFNQPAPDMTSDTKAFINYFKLISDKMSLMQLKLLSRDNSIENQDYNNTNYSKNWINNVTLNERRHFIESLINYEAEVKPGYKIGIELLDWVTSIQTDFNNINSSSAITCQKILDIFLENLLAINLSQIQKDFLIDKIMMQDDRRDLWNLEWNEYRSFPDNSVKRNTVLTRLQNLMKYLLCLAEYQIY